MATKSKVSLMLTTKEVNNAVKSFTFSKHYTEKMLRISVLNIMYRRIAIDESEFEQKKYEKVPYVVMKRKSTDKLIRHFHGISHGIVDAVDKEFLKEVWVFIKEKETKDMETYLFHLKYNLDKISKSSVTPVEIRDQTLDLFKSLSQLPSDKKYQSKSIEFSVEFKYSDEVPSDYIAPYFEDTLDPYCLGVDQKLSVILGSTNTGYHKIKCIGTGKIFSTSRSVTPATSVATQKITQETDVEIQEILDDSDMLLENEQDRFSEQTMEAITPAPENPKKKQKLDHEGDCHGLEGTELASIATESELMITCCCEWDLPSDQFELIMCSRCECYVHVVCHGFLEKTMADEVTFQCYACSGEIVDKCTPKLRVLLFYIRQKNKLPMKILQSASRLEREELLSKLLVMKVLSSDGKKKRAFNTEFLNKCIADMFRLADSQFFE